MNKGKGGPLRGSRRDVKKGEEIEDTVHLSGLPSMEDGHQKKTEEKSGGGVKKKVKGSPPSETYPKINEKNLMQRNTNS